MSGNSIYEDLDSRSLIDFEDEPSDADSLLQQDPVDHGASVAQQAAKAIDAAEESAGFRDEEEGLPPAASPPANRVWLQDVPVRDAGPAPPDYAAATAWRKSRRSRQSEQHSDESDDDLYGEIHLPESTSSGYIPPDYNDEGADNPISFRRIISIKSFPKWRRWRHIVWIIALYFGVTLMFSIPWIVRSRSGRSIRRIASEDHPTALDDACRYDTFSDYAIYKFDNVSDFWFQYESYPEEFPEVKFSRDLNLYPAPPEQEATVEVWMNVATSKPYKVSKFSALERLESIYIRDPLLMHTNSPIAKSGRRVSRRKQSCAHVWMAMYIRPELVWLQIETDSVDASLGYSDPQGKQGPLNTTIPFFELWTSTGDINALYLDSKYNDIYTETGRVTGTYALRESLDFTGDSGELDVTIVPKLCDESEKPCSNFTIQSQLNVQGVKRPKIVPESTLDPSSNVSITSDKAKWWYDPNFGRENDAFSGRLNMYRKGGVFDDRAESNV